ncbi:hypothetical protein ABPG73_018757 [Tetrahymena malaccensis]
MNQNQQLNNQNQVSQLSKSSQDENKVIENSQTSLNSSKNSPCFKVMQLSGVGILKGDDQVSVLSLSKIIQNNMNQISQNYVQEESQCLDSSHTYDSQQRSKLIDEQYRIAYKTEKDQKIQIDCSQDYSNQQAKETENEVQKQSFTQIIGQLIKKKRKNNIELQYINQKDIWKKKWLGVLFYVSKFLYIAKQCQKVFRASLLTSFQLHLIGDASSDFEQNESFSKIDFVKKFFTVLPLINSQSKFYIFWETITFFCSFINFIYLPFELSFDIQRSPAISAYLQYLCPIIYTFDILIKSNTQNFQQGNHIQQHKQIFKEYISSSFIVDFISLISLNQNILKFKGSQLLFFVRIFRSLKIIDIIREHYFSNTFYSGIISLFLLFSGSLFYGHLFACIWYYVGTQSEQGWINSNQLVISDIYSNYICSYYYAVVTMTTIGYGDITAKTTEERSVMIFLALLSCGIFGYTINSIGNILSDFKQKSDTYLTELGKLNKYLSYYQVSSQIQINARKYLKFVHQEKNKDQLSTFQSLNNLSDYLQNQIKMEVISKKLKQIQFFKNMLNEETILQLSLQVKESIYQPEQIILGQSEVKEPAIYIINHGKVLKYSQYDLTAKENSIIEMNEKENFGLIEFFMNKENSNFNYKSKDLTSIFSLELSSFLKIIKQDDESYEKFCYIRDQVIYQQYLSQVNYSCLSCQSKNHTLKECPCIFYNERHVSIIKKSLQKDQEFQDKQRKTKKRQNCWLLFHQINSKAIDFQNDNVNQLSFNECSQITEDDDDDVDEEEEKEEQKYDSNNDIFVEGIEKLETEARKSVYSQNLRKVSQDRDNFISHKTGEVLNEDDCPIGKIGQELKPKVMIQPRKKYVFDFQKSEEMKKQNSNIIEHQQDDDYIRHGRISLISLKNNGQLNQPYVNNLFNNNHHHQYNNNNNNSNNIINIQSLVQSLKDFQNLLQQNQISQKTTSLKQGNISRLNSKRIDSSTFNYTLKMERSSSLNGSNRNIKSQKQPSITIFEQKDQIQKQQQQQIEILEEDFEKLQIFKIYYPNSNYDIIVDQVNKSRLQFKIPQILKILKLKKKSLNCVNNNLIS